MQEKINLAELKRSEKLTQALLRLWRKLNKDFRLLNNKYEQLVFDYEKQKNDHKLEIENLNSDQQKTLVLQNQNWQNRFDENVKISEEKIAQTKFECDEKIKLLEENYEQKIKELNLEINLLKKQQEALISRIRGVEQ